MSLKTSARATTHIKAFADRTTRSQRAFYRSDRLLEVLAFTFLYSVRVHLSDKAILVVRVVVVGSLALETIRRWSR